MPLPSPLLESQQLAAAANFPKSDIPWFRNSLHVSQILPHYHWYCLNCWVSRRVTRKKSRIFFLGSELTTDTDVHSRLLFLILAWVQCIWSKFWGKRVYATVWGVKSTLPTKHGNMENATFLVRKFSRCRGVFVFKNGIDETYSTTRGAHALQHHCLIAVPSVRQLLCLVSLASGFQPSWKKHPCQIDNIFPILEVILQTNAAANDWLLRNGIRSGVDLQHHHFLMKTKGTTLLGANISPPKVCLNIIFLFPRWDI